MQHLTIQLYTAPICDVLNQKKINLWGGNTIIGDCERMRGSVSENQSEREGERKRGREKIKREKSFRKFTKKKYNENERSDSMPSIL